MSNTTDNNQNNPNPEANEPDLSEIQNEPEAPAPVPSGNYSTDLTIDEMLERQAKRLNARSGIQAPPPPPKNRKQIIYASAGVALLILVLGIYSMQPRKGSMAFGICSTFLELNTYYPVTLDYNDLEGSRTAVRIYFTNIDPFGEFKQEMLECKFGPDPKMGMKVTEILRNRRPVDSDVVKKFNMNLPTIMASKPYLVIPPDWKNPLLKDQ